jgi:hypothetical protein
MKYLLAVVLIVIMIAAGCRSTKKISTVIQTPKDKDSIAVVDVAKAYADSLQLVKDSYSKIIAHHIEYTYFSAKVNIEYDDVQGGNHYNFNAFIRMQKDSVIWMSVIAALGIEGFKVKVTKDSVFVLDKIAKTYQARSLDYIRDEAHLPFDFKNLQDLVVGNNICFDTAVTYFSNEGDNVMLQTEGEQFQHLFTFLKSNNTIINDKIDDVRDNHNRTMAIANTDFFHISNYQFPINRKITITDKKIINVSLNYKQVDFNQTLNFPFSIPKNYKRK